MREFMDVDFLLSNVTARKLYHDYAKDMPVIDYHCHLNPKDIYENKNYQNISELWLYGDHYKWRAMRANGIEEKYITGDADDYDRFLAWAKTVPLLIGNPLYHWTHLELQRFFGIHEELNETTAPEIWEKVNGLLNQEGFGAKGFIEKSNVEVVCTTDDPVDSLDYHKKLQAGDFSVKVVPGFRPDKALEINRDGFAAYIKALEEASNIKIKTYDDFQKALQNRVEYFHSVGGRVSDHAIDTMMYAETSKEEVEVFFERALKGGKVSLEDEKKFKTLTLKYLGEQYAKHGWVMQFHINALRNNNTRMFNVLGPDTGYDAINDQEIAKPLVQLLDLLAKDDHLPKTVLYSLNPNDNSTIASIIGSFQGDGIPGKIQFGTAWWFNDTKAGMLNQMQMLADMGVFSQFIGMLTDSRSFLSYSRHEYFRRIVCSLIGSWVEDGEVPNNIELLGEVVQKISYYNAKNYFNFE